MKLLYTTLIIIVLNSGCYEPLPVYFDPADVFEAKTSAVYFINRVDNSVKVYLTIVNKYDETFDARAILRGKLVITLKRNPAIKKTVQLDSSFLMTTNQYNYTTGVLRLDPNDTVKFGFSWNLTDDSGINLSQIFSYRADPDCIIRRISTPEELVLNAEMKMFERTQTVKAPEQLFQFQHIREFVDPKMCP